MKPIKLEILLEGKGVKKGFEDVGNATKKHVADFKSKVNEQKGLIKSIEKDIASLQKQLKRTAPGLAEVAVIDDLKSAKKALLEEKEALKRLEVEFKSNAESAKTLRTQISNLKNDLAGMTEGTKEYEATLHKLGEKQARFREVTKQGQVFSDVNKNIKATADTVAGLSGAMSAGVGIASLFGAEGEELSRIQTRLQAVMAITIGIQQVANTLNKDSYFSHIILGGAKRKMAAAQAFLNTQLGIGVGLSKALMMSGIGLLIAGVGVAVMAYQNWNKKQKEANKLKRELIEIEKEAYKSIASEVEKIQELDRIANNANKPIAERHKAIDKLNKLMPEYNGHLDKESGALQRNQGALNSYIQSLANMEMAKKLALKNAEDTLKILENEQKAERIRKGQESPEVGWVKQAWQKVASGHFFVTDGFRHISPKYARENAYNAINDILEKENPQLEKNIEERNEIINKLNESTVLTLDGLDKGKPSKIANNLAEQELAALRKIEQQRIALMEDGREKRKRQAELDYQLSLDTIEKERQANLKHLEELKQQGQKVDPGAKAIINAQANEQSENAKKLRDKNITLINKEEDKKEADRLEALKAKYQDYEEQRLAIARKYAKEREEINSKDSGLSDSEKSSKLAVIEKEEIAAIKTVNNAQAEEAQKSSDLMARLFADASQKSIAEIEKIIQEVGNLYGYLQSVNTEDITPQFGFTAEQLKALKDSPEKLKAMQDALKNLNNEVAGRSPFRKYAADIDVAIKKMKSGDIGGGIAMIGTATQAVLPTVKKLGTDLGEIFGGGELAGDIADVVDILGDVAQGAVGVGKIASGDVLGGITDVVSSVASLWKKASEAQARYEAENKAILNSKMAQQRAYNLLLHEQNLLYEKGNTIFGIDEYGTASNAVVVYKNALADLNKEIAGTQQQKNALIRQDAILQMFGSRVNNLTAKISKAGLASINIVTGFKKTGLFGWGKGKDTHSSIIDIYPKLIDANGKFNASLAETILRTRKMSDESKDALQGLIDLSAQQEKAWKQVEDYFTSIFGEMGNAMSDALTDAFLNGTDAMEAFTKKAGDMLGRMAKQMAYSVTIAPLIEKAQKDVLALQGKAGLSEDQRFELIANRITQMLDEGMAQQASFNAILAKADAHGKSKGLDILGNAVDDRKAAAKGISGLTQDQGNKLEGQMTYASMQSQQQTTEIKNMSVALHNAFAPLSKIAENTEYCKHLEAMQKDISKMTENINSMQSQGINVKR